MRKIVQSLLVLIFSTAIANGQEYKLPAEISWGEELKEPTGSSLSKIIAAGSYGFYALRLKTTKITNEDQAFVEFYNSDMKLKRSQKLDLKYKGKKRDFEDMVMVGGSIYLLTSFNNEAKKKNYLFLQKLSDRLIPSRELELIGEIDTRNKYREGGFDLILSRDSSKVLVYNQLPYQRNEPERFTLRVFNNQFESMWTKDIALPYSDDHFSVEEYQVDKEGNVYLLGVHFQDKYRVRRQGKPTYTYSVLAYTNAGADFEEYRIDLTDKFVTDLTFRVADDGNLICSGFYSDKGTYSIKGTYFFRLDAKSKEVYNVNLKPFDFEFLTEYMSQGQKNRAQRAEESGNANRSTELYRYALNDLILRSDGGAVLVAEQYYIYERSYRDYTGAIYSDYFYNYNDIIVVNIRPNGEIEWATRIPKRQETLNDGGYFSSYAMAIVRDKIYFIYNDNARNFGQENENRRRLYNFNGRYSVVALAEIRIDGSLSTFPLFTNRDADILTRPKICKQTGSRRMMVYGERGRQYRFANLKFTD
ncbi:MAG: hypothetical protein DHS20C18_31580 [Saprospiraceae bacterium]|nr:MAG: hypothetical protein DHS20C18_31580 [Saprospiraceae bacterium]